VLGPASQVRSVYRCCAQTCSYQVGALADTILRHVDKADTTRYTREVKCANADLRRPQESRERDLRKRHPAGQPISVEASTATDFPTINIPQRRAMISLSCQERSSEIAPSLQSRSKETKRRGRQHNATRDVWLSVKTTAQTMCLAGARQVRVRSVGLMLSTPEAAARQRCC
jgi:hypothetical protein